MSIFAKYSPELIFGENAPVALTDGNQKIIWVSKTFRNFFTSPKIKGKTLTGFLTLNGIEKEIEPNLKKPINVSLIEINKELQIVPIYSQSKKVKPEYFKLEIIDTRNTTVSTRDTLEIEENNIDFRNELQDILTQLVKENSIDKLSSEILIKSLNLTNSDVSIISFLDDINSFEFKFHDPGNIIKNKSEVEKIIHSEFKFISKWLMMNKSSLLAENQKNNIGRNLASTTGCTNLVISPCIFDDKLIATLIVGKINSSFSKDDINLLDQFATLLTFIISNTRTRELNTALENRLSQAQKLETIGKLSSGMAHDFGNLLSSIFGSLNLLRKRVEQTENIQRLIDNIENCSVRARDLTKGLLSFGKPTPKRKELVKPHQLIGEITKIVTQTFPKTIKLSEEIDDKLYDIVGNGTEIYQVLLNLCVNAKEAIDQSGNITIAAKNITIDENNIAFLPLLETGNYVKFSVLDDGSGIDEKHLTKIFDPYFSTKIKDTGSGLGLYVSYGIIKAHNGIIDVTSKLGMGTRFDVYIPAFEQPKAKKDEAGEKIILLADDEPMLGELLAELLETNGYSVIKVSSGKEVLTVLTEEIKVDLAIIDYNMPEMSGLETIAEIRKLNLNLPIILSSGSMWVNQEVDLSEYKINGQLNKPYEFESMLATIRKFV